MLRPKQAYLNAYTSVPARLTTRMVYGQRQTDKAARALRSGPMPLLLRLSASLVDRSQVTAHQYRNWLKVLGRCNDTAHRRLDRRWPHRFERQARDTLRVIQRATQVVG